MFASAPRQARGQDCPQPPGGLRLAPARSGAESAATACRLLLSSTARAYAGVISIPPEVVRQPVAVLPSSSSSPLVFHYLQ